MHRRKIRRWPLCCFFFAERSVVRSETLDRWYARGGLRLAECLALRVQDIDFETREILVRHGKGGKDRVTMLPESTIPPLRKHLIHVGDVHRQDLKEGWGRVQLPDAVDRKYPNAAADWRWQWVFPQRHRWKNQQTGQEGRHYIDPSLVQKTVKAAVHAAGISKRAGCHTPY